MLKRDFFRLWEVLAALGTDKETFRQALLKGQVSAWIEAQGQVATFVPGSFEGPIAPKSVFGAEVSVARLRGGAGSHPDDQRYVLHGWFRLDPTYVQTKLRSTYSGVAAIVIPPPECSDCVDGDYFEFEERVEREYEGTHYFEKDVTFSPNLDDFWFSRTALEELQSTGLGVAAGRAVREEKPLDERERTTLLCIIGALAREFNFDLSQPMKAGDAVAAMATELKWSGRSIGEHLKRVSDAMDRKSR